MFRNHNKQTPTWLKQRRNTYHQMRKEKLPKAVRLLTAIALLGGLALSRFKSPSDSQVEQIPEGARYMIPGHISWDVPSLYDTCDRRPDIDILSLDLSGGYPDGGMKAEVAQQGNYVPFLSPPCTFDDQYLMETSVGGLSPNGRPAASVELLSSSTGVSGIIGNPATLVTRGPAGETAVITATFGITGAYEVSAASQLFSQVHWWNQLAYLNITTSAQPGQVELAIRLDGRTLFPFTAGLMTVFTDTTGIPRTEISSLDIDTFTGVYPNVANSEQHLPLTIQVPPGKVQYQVTAQIPPEVTLISDGTQIGEINAGYLLYLPLISASK